MAWAQVKHYAKVNNKTFTLSGIQDLVHAGFAEVTPQRWNDLIRHTHDKVEDHYFDADGLVWWRQVPEFIIRTDEDSTDDSTDDDKSEESSDGSSESDED